MAGSARMKGGRPHRSAWGEGVYAFDTHEWDHLRTHRNVDEHIQRGTRFGQENFFVRSIMNKLRFRW